MSATATESVESGASKNGWAAIGEHYRLLLDTPAPDLDRPGARGFLARDLRAPNRSMVALVCQPDLPPRIEMMQHARSLGGAPVMIPVEWGPLAHPESGDPCLGIVFERPEGRVAVSSMAGRFEPLSAGFLRDNLILPAVEAIMMVSRRGGTHRAIRPDNIYLGREKESAMMLGECVSVPPGWAQPVYMETIEMAMAPRSARGQGGIEHDIYALGASILFLAIGYCPVAKMSDREIITRKIENGSFQCLLNGERSPLGLREPLRGMLADDPQDRWSPEDLLEWLDGSLRRPVRPAWRSQAERAFSFEEGEYRHPRALAWAFGEHWDAAVKAVQSAPFRKWIGMSTGELRRPALVDDDAEGSNAEVSPMSAQDLSRICMQLDPLGPLRYQKLVFNPDALGTALAAALRAKDAKLAELITDAIVGGVCEPWLDRKVVTQRGDFSAVQRLLQRLQGLLRNGGPTNGVERCLYELCLDAPCFSPALAGSYVYSVANLLPTLEAAVTKTGRLPPIFDRHLAAFIAARMKSKVDAPLMVVGGKDIDSIEAKLGILAMLAAVQKERGPERLPALTEALADELEPSLRQYQSRTLRSELRHRLEAVASRGKLADLHEHLDNPDLVKKDRASRERAEREFLDATITINELESSAFDEIARRSGWHIAAAVSNSVAGLAILAMILW